MLLCSCREKLAKLPSGEESLNHKLTDFSPQKDKVQLPRQAPLHSKGNKPKRLQQPQCQGLSNSSGPKTNHIADGAPLSTLQSTNLCSSGSKGKAHPQRDLQPSQLPGEA